ncbi:IS21 family transposase [Pseudomonas sp.]|uniref:IS21 family transposase n=1 Tax=Pseudomonas sp. TaxID=306 RepID=UPI003C74AA22
MQAQTYRKVLHLNCCSTMSLRQIAKQVGIAINTVRKITSVAQANQWDWEVVQDMNDRELKTCFHAVRQQENGKVMPDWVAIHKLMQAKHQTRIELWEEYRDQLKSAAYSYSQFNHYYREYLSKIDLTMRQVHFAGECVFVDYAGQTISWFDAEQGKQREAQVFVAVFGCSNYTFSYASASQKLCDWIDAHNRMFQFFGGVPETVIPDNLKSAVTTPGHDPVINKTYQEQSEHYGFVVVPARVRKPQDKAKAELGVKLVSQWITVPLRRRQFFSLEEINVALAELLEKVNQRSFKRLPGNRLERFLELDKPALKPLPPEPYEYGEWMAAQRVGPDYHIYVQNHAYSVPWRLVGERVDIRVSPLTVAFFHLSKRVALHPRDDSPGGTTTNPNHRPEAHQAYASRTAHHYLEWAYGLGAATAEVVQAQFHGKADFSISGSKACQQLQHLAKHYGNARVEAACARALAIQSPTIKSLRSILQHRLDELHRPLHPVAALIPPHANVRGSDYYTGENRHE